MSICTSNDNGARESDTDPKREKEEIKISFSLIPQCACSNAKTKWKDATKSWLTNIILGIGFRSYKLQIAF